MSHDAKTAALVFRVISVLLFGYGLGAFLVAAKFAAGLGAPFLLAPGVLTFMLAIVIFLVAPLLGRLAAAGLPPTAAPPNER
jgi:hypothetical protein